MRIAFRVLSALMAIFFAYATVVQYNDPDPLRWIAVYVAALGCSVGVVLGKSVRWLALASTIGAALWAIWWWTILSSLPDFGKVPWIEIEEARELGGLLIVTVWCLVIFAIQMIARSRASQAAASP